MGGEQSDEAVGYRCEHRESPGRSFEIAVRSFADRKEFAAQRKSPRRIIPQAVNSQSTRSFWERRYVGMTYCGIFSSSPSFLADWLATTPATLMLSDSAIFTIGVRFCRMAVTNSFMSGP